jgi:hypothetical protein
VLPGFLLPARFLRPLPAVREAARAGVALECFHPWEPVEAAEQDPKARTDPGAHRPSSEPGHSDPAFHRALSERPASDNPATGRMQHREARPTQSRKLLY